MNGHRKIFKVDIMQKVQIVLTISSTNQDLKKKKDTHIHTHRGKRGREAEGNRLRI